MNSNCIRCSVSPRLEHRIRTSLLLMADIGVLCSAGCSTIGAKPWEHDLLAEKAMQIDPYPLESASDDQLYFSKSASSGGRSFAGGGSGCS